MTAAIRERGAEPAWVFVGAGSLRVGATDRDLERLTRDDAVSKVARRDLPMVVAKGGLGATTVSATLWAAHRAGIEVAATGGIGGVHRGSGDVSADLLELARTSCTLVCSGPKSIVDARATVERLDELGVALVGYGCDRLPFFVVRETGIALEHRADTPRDVAAIARARQDLGLESALLICNPLGDDRALSAEEVDSAVLACEERGARDDIRGKSVTPYLLSCLAELTNGRSLEANIALLVANAGLAADIASALTVS
jgi:pseudouridine-5'-phosphate glycosidase